MLENIIEKINSDTTNNVMLDNEELTALILKYVNDTFAYKKAKSIHFFHYIDTDQSEKIGVCIKFN
jgi:hypothetical protein